MTDKSAVYPYLHLKGNRSKYGKKISDAVFYLKRLCVLFTAGGWITWQSAVLCFVGFFLGRTVMLGEFYPLAEAFVAACALVFPAQGLIVLSAVAAGLSTVESNYPMPLEISCLLAIWFLVRGVPPSINRPWLVLPGIVLTVIVGIKITYFVLGPGLSSYDSMGVIFEAFFGAVFTLAGLYALSVFRKPEGIRNITAEEFFCLLVLVVSAFSGMRGLEAGLFSLKGVLGNLLVLLAALIGGMGLGASAGAVVGFIPGLSLTSPSVVIGAESVAGLLAGLCRGFGKIGALLGFLFGNVMVHVLLGQDKALVQVLANTGFCALVLLFVKPSQMETVRNLLRPVAPPEQECNDQRKLIRDVMARNLNSWAGIFKELAHAFSQTAVSKELKPGLQKLFDEIGNRICVGCWLYKTCWETNFYKMHHQFLDLLTLVELYGRITPDNFTPDFRARCVKIKEMAVTITLLYEMYKHNRRLDRLLSESKEVVARQLGGLVKVIGDLSRKIGEDSNLSSPNGDLLKQKLKREKLPVYEVQLWEDGQVVKEVLVRYRECSGRMDCCYRVVPTVTRLLGQKLYYGVDKCAGHFSSGGCLFRLFSGLKYSISVGIAYERKVGSVVSGDSFSIKQLHGGKVSLILSDGMGSGEGASTVSGAAVLLLEKLLDTGYDREQAVKTLNSVMVLRSEKDMFTTVDLTIIDLYTGRAEFVKRGSAPVFVLRGREVEIVRSTELPIGVIQEIDVTCVGLDLCDGDTVIMVSDGIIDAYRKKESPLEREWVSGVLKNTGASFGVQGLAELLVELSRTGYGGRVNDDLTVIAFRLNLLK